MHDEGARVAIGKDYYYKKYTRAWCIWKLILCE